MRIVDKNFETIKESDIDLSKGYLTEGKIIRKDAKPIDNVTKFAWDDDDYEEVQIYEVNDEEKIIESKIEQLKLNLSNSDYKILKIVEGASTLQECAEIIAQRAKWRKEINELEKIKGQINE